jgi:ParB family transcriptional regulator, chromosome partitioning protein
MNMMTQQRRGLGRGLESLIPPSEAPAETSGASEGYHLVPIGTIVPNRQQPRTVFDEEKLRELASSIAEQGIIQPLAVAPAGEGRYELIAGERRLRAARLAGLEKVPVVIKDVDDHGMLALSIIENIQRCDLNPIEEARAFLELAEKFGSDHESIARKVGKSRSAISNSVRLLGLPHVIQEDVANGRYSAGHARAILGVEGIHAQLKIRERILRELPTVRDVEKMVQSLEPGGMKRTRRRTTLTPQTQQLADHLKQHLGTKVQIEPKGNGGKIVIEYYAPEDLDRIYGMIVER